MSNAAPVQPDSLPHQPQRQMGLSGGRLLTPPRRAVIHQHPFREPAALKGFFQLLAHRCAVRAAVVCQSNQVTAMIVEHRQRPHWVGPSLGPLEVHLPQFVGLSALKALRGWAAPFFCAHQIVTKENAMDGVARQLHTFPRQHDSQLARPPVRIAQAYLDYLLLQPGLGAAGTGPRPATLFRNPPHTRIVVASQPQVSLRP